MNAALYMPLQFMSNCRLQSEWKSHSGKLQQTINTPHKAWPPNKHSVLVLKLDVFVLRNKRSRCPGTHSRDVIVSKEVLYVPKIFV